MVPFKTFGNPGLSPDHLTDSALAFQKSRIFLTAYELGLFTALGDDEKSSKEVADLLGTDARATNRLLNALCAIGLIVKKQGRFANGPLAAARLVAGRPAYMAGLMHVVHLWETWSTLTQAVRLGQSVSGRPLDQREDRWLRAFIAAMHGRGSEQAPRVVALLDLSGVSRMLDVGGGSGAYAMAFVQARPDLRVTVFDLPNVIPLTRDYVAQEGLSSRIDLVAGDFHVDDLGQGYDLVFLSAILHSNGPEQNRALIRKAAAALNPGGRLVIQDFIMDEDRTTPAFGAIFALNMLVGTEAGDTYTASEVRLWLAEAGLGSIQVKEAGMETRLVIGSKTA